MAGAGCGRHLAVADSEKRLHIVDVSRNYFRRVTYDSDWPITLAEQALFVTTLAQQHANNARQAEGSDGGEEHSNPMDVLLSDATTRSPNCTASLRNVCWLSPGKSRMLLLGKFIGVPGVDLGWRWPGMASVWARVGLSWPGPELAWV